ncbi:LysR substrate-binding domain-containing protein [Curvibacter sp. RS43]|uniref:LysR substrate-binding domain-containing protein n=1 Tax=Curvibacter microcysteis TaxID=3026419 RepID=A0ABT5MEP9_9BURK|nr:MULTISPECIES: LysR substrate-binding domain-containing protein [unclassified Curvibacter]MDD0809878.1 LysR substrate-binding domain-containing protein [Curvibacter sp. RS43]MDD0815053.1 LysR substrate-binding domain-containing protein [Curvibacter sp. HBC28]
MAGHPPTPRDVLTPDALGMLQEIAQSGSFAAAARQLDLVPSALTYRVRAIEEALDVLLFDRSSRQAKLTEAGQELLREGERLLNEIDAVANRVKRVATGWEPQFTLACDGIINRTTTLEICGDFFALQPPTRLRIRDEIMTGTLQALVLGQADLALGVVMDTSTQTDIQQRELGVMNFVYVVAPHHPLAAIEGPLRDEQVRQHRAVAVADTSQRGRGMTVNLLPGQDVFTVPTMQAKVDAQLRGLGAGYLPESMVKAYLDTGMLVQKTLERPPRVIRSGYAWRAAPGTRPGRALQWWLDRLESPATRQALLQQAYISAQ